MRRTADAHDFSSRKRRNGAQAAEDEGMYIETPIHDPIDQSEPAPRPPDPPREWREWMMVAIGLTALVAVIAAAVSVVAFASSGDDTATPVMTHTEPAPAATPDAA